MITLINIKLEMDQKIGYQLIGQLSKNEILPIINSLLITIRHGNRNRYRDTIFSNR